MVTFQRPTDVPRWTEPALTATRGSGHAPDYRNAAAVLGLLEYRALEVNRRAYRVPPISGFDGAKVLGIVQRLAQVGDDVAAHLDTYTDLSAIARRLLIPCGIRRYLWHLHIRPNPLRGATMREMAWVAGFLFKCAMSGPLRMCEVEPTQSTSSKALPSSRRSSPRGPARTVSH